MLTKKMDPPALLHQDNYHYEDHDGYAILDRPLSYNNVRGDAAARGRDVAGVHVEKHPAATRPDPSVAELAMKTCEAAVPEQVYATHEDSKPSKDSSSVKSEPSPLSLRPDDLADSVLESIGSMKEDRGTIDEQVGILGQPLGMHSPVPDRVATKVKTVLDGGDDDDDDDDFTFASQESDSPLFEVLNEAVAAAGISVPAGSVGSSDAKLSTDKAGCEVSAEAPKVTSSSEDSERPPEATQKGAATKSFMRGIKSRIPLRGLTVGFVAVLGLAMVCAVYVSLADRFQEAKLAVTRDGPHRMFASLNGEIHQIATIKKDPDETAKIIPGDDGPSKELLGAELDDSLTHAGFDEGWLSANETRDFAKEGEVHFLATEKSSHQDEAHSFVVEPLSTHVAPTSDGEEVEQDDATLRQYPRLGWCQLKELLPDATSRVTAFFASSEDEHEGSAIENALQRLWTRSFGSGLKDWLAKIPASHDHVQGGNKEADATQNLPARLFEFKEWQSVETETRLYIGLLAVTLVILAFLGKSIEGQLGDENVIEARGKSELRPGSSTRVEEPAPIDSATRDAVFAADLTCISPMLERSGRSVSKNANASSHSKTYEELTSKDLRFILKSLFGHVAPVRTSKAELITCLLKSYETYLQTLKKSEIRSILESKSVSVPSYCTKQQLIECALQVGF